MSKKSYSIIPYEGDLPYMFISYAHKDVDLVLPIVEQLYEMGYRVWYDDGIVPGSEWPENIANHLSESAIFLCFITDNFVASDNCRREVSYGLSKGIPLLGIYLEPTEMSKGMEMQLSAQQCVMRYNFDSEEKFIRKICKANHMDACIELNLLTLMDIKEEDFEKAIAEGEDAASEDELAVRERIRSAMQEGFASGSSDGKEQKDARRRLRGEDYDDWEDDEDRDDDGDVNAKMVLHFFDKFARWFLTFTIACIVIFGLLLLFIKISPNPPEAITPKIKITDELAVKKYEMVVEIADQTLGTDEIKKLNEIRGMRTLRFSNCCFNQVDWQELQNTGNLEYIAFENCEGIEDFSFLDTFPSLTIVSIDHCGVTDENISWKKLKLKGISIRNEEDFTDLSLVVHEGNIEELQSIDFSYTGVQDFSIVSDMKSLREISLLGCDVTDTSFLSELQKLETIEIDE